MESKPVEDSQLEGRIGDRSDLPLRPELPKTVEKQLVEVVHPGPPRAPALPPKTEEFIKSITQPPGQSS